MRARPDHRHDRWLRPAWWWVRDFGRRIGPQDEEGQADCDQAHRPLNGVFMCTRLPAPCRVAVVTSREAREAVQL